MGNSISQKQTSNSKGKVILWDGKVHEFENPLTAAELMLEHPQQAVVEFQPAVSGKRPTPLPADKKLDTRRVYLMLPMKRGGKTAVAALPADEIRRVLLIANSDLRSRRSGKLLPMFARICPVVNVASPKNKLGETASSMEEEEEEKKKRYVPLESMELEGIYNYNRPEYLSRQLSGRGWKPSLDTIEEKIIKVENRVYHWLF